MNRSRGAETSRRLIAVAPVLLVTVVGLWLLWPVPSGAMPLSADHTVHLTRIWMYAQSLARGEPFGWSSVWFFGTPVGELYPVLGDLLVIGVRVLSLGLLDWPQAYAIGFTIVFLAQGWSLLRVGRVLGLGPIPGLVAALLVLLDAGAYREGGWIYTVGYGVWPQALASSLMILAFAELATACESEERPTRRIGTAALALAGALLAHPMSLPCGMLAVPLFVAALGGRDRIRLRRTVATLALGAVLALAVVAWYLLPLVSQRGYMVSYGWAWQSLGRMIDAALHGRFAQHMPPAVGAAIAAGIALCALAGTRAARFFVAWGVVSWVMASQDVLWRLRLDHLSEGFRHLQYQRFIIAAKPGLFLAAGVGLALLIRWGRTLWSHPRARPAAFLPWSIAAMGVVAVTVSEVESVRANAIGTVQTTRDPEDPGLDAAHTALVEWFRDDFARTDWARPGGFHRVSVDAPRNSHWFMDLPVFTGMPLYKSGFVPGDNFVHKPEASTPALLDALRVRYVVTRRKALRGTQPVGTIGRYNVLERGMDGGLREVAWLDGPGEVRVLEDDPDRGAVRVEVSGSEPGAMLVFGIAGYPRWALTKDGEPVEWVEVPVLGDAEPIPPADRLRGLHRGGKANGDDGSEPILIAAAASDGTYELRYRRLRTRDLLAIVLSIAALGCAGGLLLRRRRSLRLERAFTTARERLEPLGRPAVIGLATALALLWAIVRWREGAASERDRAFAGIESGRCTAEHATAALLKADMLLGPAVVVDRRPDAVVTCHDVTFGDELTGWVALDDDDAKLPRRGTHRLRVEVRGDGDDWHIVLDRTVAHEPGRTPLVLDTGALVGHRGEVRVITGSSGDDPPRIGFDLELGDPS